MKLKLPDQDADVGFFSSEAGFQPKQLEAWYRLFEPDCKYMLYGGAMHGGKSFFLRWAALGLAVYYAQAYNVQGVTVGLFSEDYPTLKDRQISRIEVEFPSKIGVLKATQNAGHCFFINARHGGGRILLRNLDDPSKFMSTEFAAILVEELTKNPYETFYRLKTRLRFPGVQNPKFIGATNPGGIGHVWCKSHWIDKNSGDPEQGLFQYIRATLDDNRYTTPEYRKQLESLPERLRKAYMNGDWDAFEGMFFTSFDQREQMIDPFLIPKEWELVGSLDPGWASPLSFGLQARDFKGTMYRIATYYEAQRNPQDHAAAIRKFIAKCKWTNGRMPDKIVSGHDAWAKQDRWAVMSSDKTMADVFADNGLYLQKAATDRHNGWGALKAAMPAQYKIFNGLNSKLVDQLSSVLGDEDDPEDIQGRGNDSAVPDHALDDARYGCMAIYKPAEAPRSDKPNWFNEAYAKSVKQEGWEVGMM
jgi:hypothetical protein